ncbi:hypothetical protein ACKKBF_B14460 [Auxenochlorella protothecoides x Auxenochlorella symbiontica]
MNWSSLFSVSPDAIFHASDITSLNSVLPSLLTGGLEGEDDRDLGPDTFRHTFSLCQLALQYLAHVQEDLLRQNRDLKARLREAWPGCTLDRSAREGGHLTTHWDALDPEGWNLGAVRGDEQGLCVALERLARGQEGLLRALQSLDPSQVEPSASGLDAELRAMAEEASAAVTAAACAASRALAALPDPHSGLEHAMHAEVQRLRHQVCALTADLAAPCAACAARRAEAEDLRLRLAEAEGAEGRRRAELERLDAEAAEAARRAARAARTERALRERVGLLMEHLEAARHERTRNRRAWLEAAAHAAARREESGAGWRLAQRHAAAQAALLHGDVVGEAISGIERDSRELQRGAGRECSATGGRPGSTRRTTVVETMTRSMSPGPVQALGLQALSRKARHPWAAPPPHSEAPSPGLSGISNRMPALREATPQPRVDELMDADFYRPLLHGLAGLVGEGEPSPYVSYGRGQPWPWIQTEVKRRVWVEEVPPSPCMFPTTTRTPVRRRPAAASPRPSSHNALAERHGVPTRSPLTMLHMPPNEGVAEEPRFAEGGPNTAAAQVMRMHPRCPGRRASLDPPRIPGDRRRRQPPRRPCPEGGALPSTSP